MQRLGVLTVILCFAGPAFAQSQAALANRTEAALLDICVNSVGNDPVFVATSCDISQGLGGAVQTQAALQASPREANAASSTATQTTTSQVESQKTRLEQARVEPAAAGGGGSAGGSEARFGGFLNGTGGFGEVDARGETDDYDVWGAGVNTGIDYRFTDQFVGGIGFGWNHQDAEFDDQTAAGMGTTVGGGGTESDSYTPSLYGSFFNGPLYVDGVLTYTFVDYEFERAVDQPDITSPFLGTARGDADAHQFGASIGGGYAFEFGGLSVGPAAQLNYLLTSIDGYSESGVPGMLALDYDDQTIRSVLTSVGAEASYAISTPIGVVVPHVRGSWEHEFENDERNIDARLVSNVDSSVTDTLFSRTVDPDRDYARVGGGVSAQLKGGFAAFVDYDAIVGLSDVEYHRFTAGGRMEF
jgi:uncharacterized protein YhjY with autotransporter beta-barrel domain